MSISVIIPSYRSEMLHDCIAAFNRSQYKPHEIIVVNDGCADVLSAEKTSAQLTVCVITLPRRAGPAKARNIGARAATGDIFCFLDSDVIVGQDTLALIDQTLSAKPEIAALQTRVSSQCGMHDFASRYQNNYLSFYGSTIRHECLSTIVGHCFAIRRADFELAGGFDETITDATVEDGNLGLTLYRLGKLIYFNKDITVEHRCHITLWGILKKIFMKSSAKIYTVLKGRMLFTVRPDRTEHSLKIIPVCVAPLIVISSVLVCHIPGSWYVLCVCVGLFLWSNRLFFHSVHEDEGFFFLIKTILFHYVNCFFAACGIGWGLMRYLFGEIHECVKTFYKDL